MSVSWGGRRQRFGESVWLLWAPGTIRSQRFAPGTRILSVRWSPGRKGTWRGLPLFLAAEVVPELTAAAEALLATWAGAETPADHCRSQSALWHWAAAWWQVVAARGVAVEPWAAGEPRLARALDLLGRARGLGSLPWPELVATAGCSRAQLGRLAHRHLGCSLRAWQEARCTETAESLLLAGELTVEAIAHHLGFHDGSHFAKWFRRHHGTSPTGWLWQGGGV